MLTAAASFVTTGPVVIVCDPEGTPKQMYAAMGFRPVAMKRSYWKIVGP